MARSRVKRFKRRGSDKLAELRSRVAELEGLEVRVAAIEAIIDGIAEPVSARPPEATTIDLGDFPGGEQG